MKRSVLFFLILLLALLLRIPHLDDIAYGIDEDISIRDARLIKDTHSLSYLYLPLPAEVNPPLFFHILAIPLFIFDSIISMRLLMVLIGLLSIVMFYFFAKKIFNPNFALFSMFLYTINPMHIVYSQHIRVYILLSLLFPLSLYFLYKFLIERNSTPLIYLAIVYAISFYSHYYTILFMVGGAITVFAFYFLNKNVKLAHYFILVLVLAIVLIPALLLLVQQFTIHKDMGGTIITPLITPSVMLYPLWKYSIMVDVSSTLASFSYIALLFPLVVALAIYGAYLLYKENKEKFIFIILNLLVPYILYTLAGFIFPVYSFRYLSFFLPLYVLLFSYGLFKIKNTWLKLALLLILTISWSIIISFYYSILEHPFWGDYIAV